MAVMAMMVAVAITMHDDDHHDDDDADDDDDHDDYGHDVLVVSQRSPARRGRRSPTTTC